MGGPDPDGLAGAWLEASPYVCYAVDDDGRLVWWNDALAETVGYDGETLSGLPMVDLLAPVEGAEAPAAFESDGGLPSSHSDRVEVITGNGERVPYRFEGVRLEVDGESVLAGFGRDVSELVRRERDCRRRREEFENLDRISETVYDVIQAVADAATRSEIERVACERLAECELYQAVWVGRYRPGEAVDPQAGVGRSADFLEVVQEMNDVDWRRPARVAVETGETQVTQHVMEADVPDAAKAAAERFDIGSGIAVPLVNRGRIEGVLAAYSSRPDGFNEREREALRRLGFVVGFAIHAVQTERLILSETATELRFRATAPSELLAALSERADGRCRREWSTRTESGAYRHYVTVDGLEPEHALEFFAGRDSVESATHVGSLDGEEVFEVVTADSVAQRLLDVGAATASVGAADGESTIVAEIPGRVDARPIVEAATEREGTELVSKRTVDRPVRTADEFHDPVAARLTDRQEAALKHAYHRGYFSWPREATAEEVADALDVASPTLHYHLRRAEQALVESFLEYLE